MNTRFQMVVAALAIGWLMAQGPRDCDAAEEFAIANLAVGNNADGRLEVFHVDRNGELHHRWQRESTHDWSSWSSLRGAFSPGVTVANDRSGRLAVFVVERDTKLVAYDCQKVPNSPAWSNWTTLPGQRVEPPVAVCAGSQGRREVFAVGADDHSVKHIFQSEFSGGWSEWADMGATLEPGLQVARNRAGQLEVFGVQARDGCLIHCWQAAEEEPDRWTAWFSSETRLLPGFAVGRNGDGRLEVFGVDPERGEVAHSCQLSARPDSSWSKWLGMGVKMKPGIAVGRNPDNRLELFAVSPEDDMVYGAYQYQAGTATNWTRWRKTSSMGGLYTIERNSNSTPNKVPLADMGVMTKSYPALGTNLEGRFELFTFDERHADILSHRSQIAGELHWTDWFSLDRATAQYLLRAWRIDEGLPDNRVQAIAQTTDGYLWVGTHNGLAKFDGVHFATVDFPTALALTNLSVTCLLVGSDGGLWIGLDGGGLARIYGGKIQRFGKTNGLAGDHLTTIYEDAEKSLWIGTTTGLSHYKNGIFINHTRPDELGTDAVQSVLEDYAGNFWVATAHGLTGIHGKTFTTFTNAGDLGQMVKCLWLDAPGRLWIGSDRGLVLHRSLNLFYAYDKHFGLSDRIVNLVRGDSQGNLWVGTYSGLTRFEEGRFVEDLENEGASLGKINSLLEDREGDIWVGSQNGLFRLIPKRLLSYNRRQGLTQNNVSAVMESDDGSFWIGTSGGGLNQLKDGSFAAYAAAKVFPPESISALCKSRDGSLWIGGDYNSGLAQIKDGKLARWTVKEGLPHSRINVIHEDHFGCLWVGGSSGLSCFRDGKFTTYSAANTLAGDVVRDICEDLGGNLWIGTEGGLSLYQDGRFTSYTTRNGLSDSVVTALYSDSMNSLWIGTENGGLNRFHNGQFTSFTKSQGLFSSEIMAMVEDDFGWLWMTCSKGVFRVSKANLNEVAGGRSKAVTSIAYGHDDGMESVLCSAAKPGAWKMRDGQLWFPTSLGLVAMDPRAMSVNHIPPPVYIEQMIVNGKPMLHQDNVFSSEAPAAPVRIPPGRSELEFHYTALNFQRPERIRFRYKLEGADPDWIEADTRRVAYYNNLPPGSYSFHVMACNNDGVWNEAGAMLSVILPTHFWQTWWFSTAAVIFSLAGVSGVSRYATKIKMQRKLEMIKHQHALEMERGRLARDIHDDLGSSLTRIMLVSQRAREDAASPARFVAHADKIILAARSTVQALDEIIWAVNPKGDSLDGLVGYITQYASQFFGETTISYRLEMPADIPTLTLSAEVRHDLFLVVKEAFNNVFKHSGASEVRLRLAHASKQVTIIIEDNGHGFEVLTGKTCRQGNGLENMRKRIEKLGGEFSLSTAAGRGSKLTFCVPIDSRRNGQ